MVPGVKYFGWWNGAASLNSINVKNVNAGINVTMVDAVIDVILGAVFDDAKCEREIVGDGIEGVGPQTNAQTDDTDLGLHAISK